MTKHARKSSRLQAVERAKTATIQVPLRGRHVHLMLSIPQASQTAHLDALDLPQGAEIVDSDAPVRVGPAKKAEKGPVEAVIRAFNVEAALMSPIVRR